MSGQSGRLIELAAFDNPRPGSFVPMLLSILRGAKEAGWEAEMVFETPASGGHEWHAEFERIGVPIRFAPPGNRRELGRWVDELLEESQAPTVLHTHFTTFDMPAVLGARGKPHAHVVWHQHMDLSKRPQIMVRNAIKFGGFGRLTDRIVCPARDTAEDVKRVGAPKKKVTFITNGIDVDRFPLPSDAQRAAARSELGLQGEEKVLLHFGWDWERKGGDVFLGALKALRERSVSGFAGVTVTADPAAEGLRSELGLGDEARVVPPQPDVQALYAAADMFVTASRAEVAPFATLEALSSGLPVVASDLEGHRYVADAIPACTICGPGPGALADAIEAQLERGAPLREAEARRTREAVEDSFGLAAWSERLLALFDEVAKP